MKNRPTKDKIARAVCKEIGVPYTGSVGVKSNRRGRDLYIARALIVHIAHGFGYYYAEIAQYAGYSAHNGASTARTRLILGEYGMDWKKSYSNILASIMDT